MKKIYLAVAAALILGGCSYSTFQYKASCKVSNSVLFERLTAVLVNEGLQIKTVTGNYLQAESSPQSGRYGVISTNVWVISASGDTVTLKASTRHTLPDFENVGDVGDGTKADVTWYWNVRREIESICSSKIVVFESKKQ